MILSYNSVLTRLLPFYYHSNNSCLEVARVHSSASSIVTHEEGGLQRKIPHFGG